MADYAEVKFQFICPECNETINHDYTEEDVQTLEFLDLTCQKCGYQGKKNCNEIIDIALDTAKDGLKKQLEELGFELM